MWSSSQVYQKDLPQATVRITVVRNKVWTYSSSRPKAKSCNIFQMKQLRSKLQYPVIRPSLNTSSISLKKSVSRSMYVRLSSLCFTATLSTRWVPLLSLKRIRLKLVQSLFTAIQRKKAQCCSANNRILTVFQIFATNLSSYTASSMNKSYGCSGHTIWSSWRNTCAPGFSIKTTQTEGSYEIKCPSDSNIEFLSNTQFATVKQLCFDNITIISIFIFLYI